MEAARFESLDAFNAADIATMTVMLHGKPTDWTWSFAGPGHEKTVAYAEKQARDRLAQDRLKEQAQVNGRKWKAPEEDVGEVRSRNVAFILARLVGWSPIVIGGQDFPFSEENARTLLSDPGKPFFQQALDFLLADDSFTPRSAKS